MPLRGLYIPKSNKKQQQQTIVWGNGSEELVTSNALDSKAAARTRLGKTKTKKEIHQSVFLYMT